MKLKFIDITRNGTSFTSPTVLRGSPSHLFMTQTTCVWVDGTIVWVDLNRSPATSRYY